MRVLVVTPWFPSAQAPVEGAFVRRDVELLAADHDVTVLHLMRPQLGNETDPDFENFEVVRVPFRLERPMMILTAARRIRVLARSFDLIHSVAFSSLLPVWLARPKLPWVHTEHYSQLVTPPASVRMAMVILALKPLFRKPTETIAVSRSLASVIDRYRKRSSTIIDNEVMRPNGALPANRDVSQVLRMIGVGGIISRKGPIPAVEALAELRSRGVPAELVWVGDGAQRDEMLGTAKDLGVAEHLTLTGQLTPEQLSKELLASDLFLLPVYTETFGVAIAEALTHGLPVVATGTGGHEEFLKPEYSRLISERRAAPLADAVQEVLSSPETWNRERIARAAQERFSDDARRDAYRDVYARAQQAAGSRR